MGINCAILTYNGTAFFGFTGDVHAAPDLKRLEKFVDESFAELRARAGAVAEAEVGAKPQRQKRVRPNGKIPVAKTPVAGNAAKPAAAQTETKKQKIPAALVEAPDFSPAKQATENSGL